VTPAPARVPLEVYPGEIRRALSDLAALLGTDTPAWVVGGAVRDALLGRKVTELDVAVRSGALALGRMLAARMSGAFVVLDEARGMGRVVGPVQVDLGDFRAATLPEDLRALAFANAPIPFSGAFRGAVLPSPAALADAVQRRRPTIASASGSVEETAARLAGQVRPGDVVVVMGGGRSYRIAELLIERLTRVASLH